MAELLFDTARDRGERFGFGRNWRRFLSVLNEERIAEAQRSLQDMLGIETLTGKCFLDVGSGSGLFSLAAQRLGAERVHSFDFDPDSVSCTSYLRREFASDPATWTVDRASVLDASYLPHLGTWDVVYSWGVLHHTGAMWTALRNVAPLVAPSGSLFISIYNDQGDMSRFWTEVKRAYNRSRYSRWLVLGAFVPFFMARGCAADVLLRHKNPLLRYRVREGYRGMSALYDMFDWLGGYPFEVAASAEISVLYEGLGFSLERLITVGRGHGCNQYVFRRR